MVTHPFLQIVLKVVLPVVPIAVLRVVPIVALPVVPIVSLRVMLQVGLGIIETVYANTIRSLRLCYLLHKGSRSILEHDWG